MMKVGWHFENLLQRALLAYAFRLPNGSPEFRYVQHEVVEESQHSMMFQELVDRSGLAVSGMPFFGRIAARVAIRPLPRIAPASFFFMVLGGEDPVDHLQRQLLKVEGLHPLAERIMRIHVLEEARHLCFARGQIKRLVPALAPAPSVDDLACRPGHPRDHDADDDRCPRPVADQGRRPAVRLRRQARWSASHRRLVHDCVAKPRRLAAEVGLSNPVSRFLWWRLGLGQLATA